METQKTSPGKFALSYGVVLGLVVVLISVITYVTGLQLEGAQWLVYINYLIFACTIFYAISQYKKNNASFLKLSEALKIGLVIGVITGLISAIYTLIFNNFIDPGYMDQMMEMNREKMMENNNMTKEMMEQTQAWMEIAKNPWVISASTIAGNIFFGFLYALIGGLIMRKQDPHF